MTELCSQCHEKPATDTLPWYIALPLALVGGGGFGGRLCGDCAGGNAFIGVFWLAVLAVAAFIVMVVIW
jgi:hypothetical protein